MANRRAKVDIYGILKERILYLDMKPGEKLIEADIAAELGVSRTPVREVLKKLQEEKFVDIYPQNGTFVSLIDYSYMKEVNYMRHILECDILNDLCSEKVQVKRYVEEQLVLMDFALKSGDFKSYIKYDSQFHRKLFEIRGHGVIWEYIRNTMGHYTRMLVLEMMIENSLGKSYDSHIEIVEAIESGDHKRLSLALEDHHDHKVTDMDKQIMNDHPKYFV